MNSTNKKILSLLLVRSAVKMELTTGREARGCSESKLSERKRAKKIHWRVSFWLRYIFRYKKIRSWYIESQCVKKRRREQRSQVKTSSIESSLLLRSWDKCFRAWEGMKNWWGWFLLTQGRSCDLVLFFCYRNFVA